LYCFFGYVKWKSIVDNTFDDAKNIFIFFRKNKVF